MRITIIGAGGMVFPVQLVADVLAFPALQEATFALMDIDPIGLERTTSIVRRVAADRGLPATFEPTTDRRKAIEGSDFVITTFQIGGRVPFRLDTEIPRRYGVDQTIGDTLGPGGVFRFLRNIPVFRGLVSELAELAPDALLINYVNPMAMNTWLLDALGARVVGMCHSIPGTAGLIADRLGIGDGELEYLAAGINHQAWFLELRHRGDDVYPRFRDLMVARYLGPEPPSDERPIRFDRVRTEIMRSFGYFPSESSHHASEYLPYFRRTPELTEHYIPHRADYFEASAATDVEARNERVIAAWRPDPTAVREQAAPLIESIASGTPRRIYTNVRNRGLIPNLPDGCVVEVPSIVDATGVHPQSVPPLAPQCAALNRSNIGVQELAVTAVLEMDREDVHRAVALDPLTAAVLPLPRIRAMVDELFEAEGKWIEETFDQAVDQTVASKVTLPRS